MELLLRQKPGLSAIVRSRLIMLSHQLGETCSGIAEAAVENDSVATIAIILIFFIRPSVQEGRTNLIIRFAISDS